MHRQCKSIPSATYASPLLVNRFLLKNSSFDCYHNHQLHNQYGDHRKYSREWPNPLTPPINFNRKFGGSRGSNGLDSSNGSIMTNGGMMSNRKKSVSTSELPSITSLQTPPRSFSPLTPCGCYEKIIQPEDERSFTKQEFRQVEVMRDSLILNRQSVWKDEIAVEYHKNNDSIDSAKNENLDSNKCINSDHKTIFVKGTDSLNNGNNILNEIPFQKDISKDSKIIADHSPKEIVKNLAKNLPSKGYVPNGHSHLHHLVSFDNASTEVLSSWSRRESPFSSGYSSPVFQSFSFSRSASLVEEQQPTHIIPCQGEYWKVFVFKG